MRKSKKIEAADFNSILKSLEENLDLYLGKKAPQLPTSWKEFLVKIVPYLAIIGVVIGVPGVLALLGMGTFVVPFSPLGGVITGRPFLGVGYLVTVLFLAVTIVLEGLAIPGLFSRSKKGWIFLYYAALVGAVHSIITFNVGGLVIGTLLSLYLLFQIKEYYK